MKYISGDSLDTISYEEISEIKAAEFFCKYAYKYLYVTKADTVVSILKKEDVPGLDIRLPELDTEKYIVSDIMVSEKRIHEEFLCRPYVNRLAVLNSNGKLIGEFNDGSLPDRARNIRKNILALRYAVLFTHELKRIFAENHWESVLVISDQTVYESFRNAFSWVRSERSDRYIQTNHDVIFNFCYLDKLMHYFCNDSRINEISKTVEKAAFRTMIDYLDKSGIEYLLLRAPEYYKLSCLSELEKENKYKQLSQHELIFSDEYMSQFSDSGKFINFLRKGGQFDSYVEDNGWIIVHNDSSNKYFNVKDGRRQTLPEIREYRSSIYIYGACLVYGFFSEDSKTICSLLQQKDICNNIRVVNHGTLLGRDLLNMVMDILSTEYKSGDKIILIDIFENYTHNSELGIIDTTDVFNEYKPDTETWFLDFPLHCNSKANQLIADVIEKNLMCMTKDSKQNGTYCFLRECGKNKRKIYYILHKQLADTERKRINEITWSAGAESIFVDHRSVGVFPEQNISSDEHFAIVHYGLERDYHLFPQYHYYIESIDMLTPGFMKKISDSFRIRNKKVLLYLGKFPEKSYDVDGGAQLANQLISSLSHICKLDIAFIRKEKETYSSPFVNQISYEEYIDPYGNKFSRRMKNFDTNRSAIMNGNNYDLIIAGHCSKFFGVENEKEIMEKSVIFPMMLTSGYKRSGEYVPEYYTEREKMVLENVSGIITPSMEEYADIVSDYGIEKSKIKVIPRGISPYFSSRYRSKCSVHANLVSIGSFKSQKNHISELKCIKMLVDSGLSDIHLTVIGTIHDKKIYNEFCEYIDNNRLESYITMYHNISQEQVAKILDNMDICISCSLWETFGRGIFECMMSGLPCVLSDRLNVIKNYAGSSMVFFCKDIYEMADSVRKLISSDEIYRLASAASVDTSHKVSYNMEREKLVTALIYDRFGFRTDYMSWNDGYDIIWEGTYSECQKYGDRVRKFYKYPNENKIRAEFFAQKCAYDNGILTAEPLFISSDRKTGRFFAESKLIRHIPANSCVLSNDIFESCIKAISSLSALPTNLLRPFSDFIKDFYDSAKYYRKISGEDISGELEWLFGLENIRFVHGDMLLKNIGICGDEIYLFDFQNACCGPDKWDMAYFFSEFLPDKVQEYIDSNISRYILLILKIRIGRAVRHGDNYAQLNERLCSWKSYL